MLIQSRLHCQENNPFDYNAIFPFCFRRSRYFTYQTIGNWILIKLFCNLSLNKIMIVGLTNENVRFFIYNNFDYFEYIF